MINKLKDNYYTLWAKNRVLHYNNYSFKVPISTGSPLLDSSVVEKIQTTSDLIDHEHLLRSWRLFANMTAGEEAVLMNNLDDILNDHKILLALIFWKKGDFERTMQVLRALPWGWRIQFPILVIKPSYVFFTGWKKELDFRLIKNIDYVKLRSLFGKMLEEINEKSILKYRRKIKVSWALLKYNPSTKKERAIEDWCFHKGNKSKSIKLINIYTKSRDFINSGNKPKFIKFLDRQDETIPLTSYMGLIGSNRINLNLEEDDLFRDYAFRSASFVETVLRLREWSQWPQKGRKGFLRFLTFTGPYWLDQSKARELGNKVKEGVKSINIPFDKITNAYLNCDKRTKELLTDEMYIPLLKQFGKGMGKILPPKFTFVQPANMIHIDSFLTYNVFNVSSNGKMLLIGENKVHEFTFSINELKSIIYESPREIEQYLLRKFGELTDKYSYTYNPEKIAETLNRIDKESLLVIDLPFFQNLDVMNAIKNHEYILNMNSYYGAPNEISLFSTYVPKLSLWTPNYSYACYRRQNNAYQLVNYIRLTNVFKKMGEDYGTNT